ncbi:RidA family protein [Pseudarthrobacter sp. RMG13]|uniref:RidA family protein n=1 Tax=Pseudarthrobacter humi TaxID=2952523 RepID=A0ABT1LNZ6_9MICC|nr:RidA family protein [Pseudarthrobacter humi]MCP8999854.1 RidA family protein [Pseudarthrobacter humi]
MTTTAVNHLPASHDPATSLASAVTIFNSIAVSTQIPRKPDGSVELGDIREQSRQVLENLQTALARAGTSLSNVLQLTIYLTDMSERTGFNEVYEEFFPRPYPSRCAVEVSSLARTGMKVEVTAMAAIPPAGT